MTVLDAARSPEDALAGLADMRALFDEAIASYGPPPEPVVIHVMDSAKRKSELSAAAFSTIVGPALHKRTKLGRVEDVLSSPLPAEYREESRLASRRVTEDRSEAQQHAKRRDELGERLVAAFNRAVSQLNAWFDAGGSIAAGELVGAHASSPAASTPKPKGRPKWD